MNTYYTAKRVALVVAAILITQGAHAASNSTYQDMQAAEQAHAIASGDVPAVYAIGSIVQLKRAGSGAKSLYEIREYGPNGELILNNTREYSTRLMVQQNDVYLPVREAAGFHVGDRVNTSYAGNVRIVALYPDGTAITAGVDRDAQARPNGSFWRMAPGEYTAAPTMADRLRQAWAGGVRACSTVIH